ncbi:MAG: potassium-transporting ATPase subunit KdpC [Deltaproteobacteria bacterium]|nr:potassium-transporting ATPase subunit KdpC [Deltaproteobacteria bacterium]
MIRILKEVRSAVVATIVLIVIVSGVYPVIVWGIAQGLFPFEANGSLINKNGIIIGSRLIAQNFTKIHYFHPRPSSAGTGYDPVSSGGSNFGPLSRTLVDTVRQRVMKYRTENSILPGTEIPADAVTASASGLDPHISLGNARQQAARVARARGLSEEVLLQKIATHLEGRDMGILGEPRVNVVLLNLDMDGNK